jgi:deoxyribodipyrimidine photo-lyase
MELRTALERMGGGLIVVCGRARDDVPRLANLLQAQAVYTNHDYEPAAIERDCCVQRALMQQGGLTAHV